tara:strand:- start:3370 stop:3549 length:180 start_codon:yes stop_codon:yes gene_type:complete
MEAEKFALEGTEIVGGGVCGGATGAGVNCRGGGGLGAVLGMGGATGWVKEGVGLGVGVC